MGPMRKKIIFILLALLMLGTIAYFYVNRILLPELHTRIESHISEQIGKSISIGKIRLEPTHGFRLHNILIKDSERTLVQIDEIDCTLLLAPFFKDRTVVIPNITIRKPIAHIVHNQDGSFNFSSMIRKDRPSEKKSKTQVFITHIKIVKGSIDFVKKTETGDFSENFRDIGIDLSLSMDRQIDFRLKSVLPFDSTAIEATGRYALGSKDFYTEIKASQLNIQKYQQQFLPSPQFEIVSGELSTCDLRVDYVDNKLKISGDAYFADSNLTLGKSKYNGDIRLLNTTLLLDKEGITTKGEIRLPAMKLTVKPGETFEGDWQLFIESLTRKKGNWFLAGNIKARNVILNWPNKNALHTHLVARDMNLNFQNKQLAIFGDFDFEDALFSFGEKREFKGNVLAKNMSLNRTDGVWRAKSSLRSENTSLNLGASKLINSTLQTDQMTVYSDNQRFSLEGSLSTQDMVFAFGDTVKFQGSPNMRINYDRPRTNPKDATVTANFNFKNGLIFGIPRVEALSNLQGELELTKQGAATQQMSFMVENTHIDVTGKLLSWSSLDMQASAYTPSVDLTRLTPLVPEIFEKFDVNLEGRTSLRMDFAGSGKDWKTGEIELEANLIDSQLTGEKIPGTFENINGTLRYTKDKIAWSKLQTEYKKYPFELNGKLENFSRPVINTQFKAANLDARAKINLLNKSIRLPSINAQYHQSDFDGSADIYFITGQEPEIQINGRGTVYASDLANFAPQHSETIRGLEPTGIFDTKLFFKGKPNQRLDWSIDVDAKSQRITVKNHELTDLKISYLQRDKNISKLNVNADVYDGKLKIDSSANLENKNFPFVLALGIYNSNMANFMAVQNPDKSNDLAGTFSLNLGLEGELLRRETWSGQGNYKLENGYIWDFKIIKLLNKILIQEFVRTVYTDSSATFVISDEKIGTENLALKSDTISLLAKGYIGLKSDTPILDQKISFDVYPALSEIARIQSDDEFLKKFTTVMVSRTLNIIKLSGTVKEPKTNIVPTNIPTNILKGATDILKGVGETFLDTIMGQ